MAKDIELGSKVKCKVTGFTGIAVAVLKSIHKCDRYHVQPPVNKDGIIPEAMAIDGLSLTVVAPPEKEVAESIPAPETKVGALIEKVMGEKHG